MGSALAPGNRVHVLGCGGTGMSALCWLLVERGCAVSGCDATEAPALADLRAGGVRVAVGHDPDHLGDVDVVTASPAVAESEPELLAAAAAGLPVLARSAVMAELAAVSAMVGFAGTHGKTTATSMAAHVWVAAGRDPGWLLGADVVPFGPGGRWREGADLLCELDESYGTFGGVTPDALGLLAVDDDHFDHYGGRAALDDAFAALCRRTRGVVVGWIDHRGVRTVLERAGREFYPVGTTGDRPAVRDVTYRGTGSRFSLATEFGAATVVLNVPGAFNVANAAVTATVALARGIEPAAVVAGLRAFPGAPRRFQVIGTFNGTTVVEDFAHLPEEVAAVVAAARQAGYADIVAVFQPHRVTRTIERGAQFAGAFAHVRALIVTDLYAAGEANPAGVTGALVADAVTGGADAPSVRYAPTLAEATELAAASVGRCQLLLVLGAGDVASVAHAIAGRYG